MTRKAQQAARKTLPIVAPAPTERGQRTQRALIDAALELMEGGRSFNSLSMREVTRVAGVVPTAFYRHFADMDELGLAMVDDVGRSLRPMLRRARMEGATATDIIRGSMQIYGRYVEEHPRYFLVASGERHGGSPVIREAIRREVDYFVDEMTDDLKQLRLLPDLNAATIRNICELVVNTMLSAASDILDRRKADSRVRAQQIENYVQQLRVIFLGAATWREK
jgi:AcrR family transcriptional regulator